MKEVTNTNPSTKNAGSAKQSGTERQPEKQQPEKQNGGAAQNGRNDTRAGGKSDEGRPQTDAAVRADQIKPDMPVVCSEDGEFATVDHMEGKDTIKLKKDEDGKHHFIPLSWVTSVDDQVHIDRPGDQAMQQWRAEA